MADVVVDADNKNPKQLLGQGIKAYVLEDFDAAVTALGKASELLVQEHGDDLHESLGEVYLYYGKALLGLAREESNVLGDAIPKDAEESDEDEENGEENAEGDDGEEKKDEGNEKTETEKEVTNNEENEKKSTEEKAEKMDVNEENAEQKSENGATVEESTDEKTENENEPSDLQVAWEVLELAKKIYEKQGEKGKRNLAETLIVLGEISLESENFKAAVDDMKQGLEIQKSLFDKDSRKVAETYYKLGVAYSTNSQIDEAIVSFKEALEYLKNRVATLEKAGDEFKDEIKEVQNLIPDIEEKISDMKTYKDEAVKQIISAVTQPKVTKPADGSSTSGSTSSSSVNDISHLVKKKRKLDEITEDKDEKEANPAKKPAV